MTTLQDAVRQVQQHAWQNDLDTLDAILRDAATERGARFAAANYLARAGTEGFGLLG